MSNGCHCPRSLSHVTAVCRIGINVSHSVDGLYNTRPPRVPRGLGIVVPVVRADFGFKLLARHLLGPQRVTDPLSAFFWNRV